MTMHTMIDRARPGQTPHRRTHAGKSQRGRLHRNLQAHAKPARISPVLSREEFRSAVLEVLG